MVIVVFTRLLKQVGAFFLGNINVDLVYEEANKRFFIWHNILYVCVSALCIDIKV